MTSTTPGQARAKTVADENSAAPDAPLPAKPAQSSNPEAVQPVDQATQEEAAEERATSGGYN